MENGWFDDLLRSARAQGDRITTDEVDAAMPESLRSERAVAETVGRLVEAGIEVSPEAPEPAARCLLEVVQDREGNFHVAPFRDRAQGHGPSLSSAVGDLLDRLQSVHIPQAEASAESVERLVRAAGLREVVRTLASK